MENFVLNLFSDQLSKIILNFHQSTINANFLSGKGSITNVKLNVDLINDFLNKPSHGGTVPFLEFTEITLTELRVEVTSYTNLKKAPIVLVIEEIHAKAREPLEYHVDTPSNAQKKSSEKEESSSTTTSPPKKNNPSQPQQYGLLHRILDNLSVKIKRIHLSFSSLGKFKTRRRGIWSPPTLQVCLDNVEWISVTETGDAGTPDMVWAHNELGAQQSRFKIDALANNQQHRHRSYTIYKRLSMLCSVKLLPSGEQNNDSARLKFTSPSPTKTPSDQLVSNLISDTQMDVHLAYVRRLRDASVTGADMDVKVYDVDINLDVASYCKKESSIPSGCDLGAFVHMLVGLIHCYYKDRSFVDPLLPEGVMAQSDQNGGLLRGFSPPENNAVEEEEAGPDDFLPEVALMDDDLESSDESDYEEEPDEEHDEAFLAWKREQDANEGDAETNGTGSVEVDGSSGSPMHDKEKNEEKASSMAPKQNGDDNKLDTSKEGGKPSYKRKRKAVIVVASGAQKFEKLSFSFSVPRINMKLLLPPDENESNSEPNPECKDGSDAGKNNHCLELLLEGLVAECIWPKNKSGEMGGHVQGSISYMHIIDSAYQKEWGTRSGTFGPKPWNVVKIFPLLRIGTRLFQGHNAFSLSPRLDNSQCYSMQTKCDEFPMMEDRQTTWRWDRQLKGPRAFAFKSTISFVDETLTRWTKTHVNHEASLGELEVVMDSAPLERLSKLFSDPTDEDNIWFDNRWLTGEWHAEIAVEMIQDGKRDFCIKDHLQPLPSLYPASSKQSALSSELRRVTAHLDSVTVRLPNPMQDLSSFRMADVIFSISEATILVTSDLPSSFLSGVVSAENTMHDFPNDVADISSVTTEQLAMSAEQATKFRMQMSFTDCSLRVLPVQAYLLKKERRFFCDLIAPTHVTILMILEHGNAQQSSIDADNLAQASRSFILSVLVQGLASNVELRSLYGALETFRHHAQIFKVGFLKEDVTSDNSKQSMSSKPKLVGENIAEKNSTVCIIHVPDVEVNVWGEQENAINHLKISKTISAEDLQHFLLCQVKASQFEFGMEFINSLIHSQQGQTKGAVFKCAIESVLIEICSQIRDNSADFKMVEILSMGSAMSGSSQLVEKACAICFPNTGKVLRRGFFLRSETDYADHDTPTSANAVEIASPMSLDVDMKSIELFLNLTVECLLSPVFVGVGSKSRLQIGQTPLGSAIFSSISQIATLFRSHQPEVMETEDVDKVGNSLLRLYLYQLLVIIPSTEGNDSFGLTLSDAEIAVGQLQSNMNKFRHIVEKSCGSGDQTWLKLFHVPEGGLTAEPACDTFYAIRSNHSMLRVQSKDTGELKLIIPASNINWSVPVGIGGSSTAPPFDISAMKELSLSMMNMGMPLSSLYFKLYKLSPQNEPSNEFSFAAKRLHDSIGSYHCKMHNFIGKMNAEVDRLRKAVFSKENERVGALALASSNASGWVRVGEDLSFSHRIFSSATLWRYWMVLDKSLLILYKSPGTKPSFIIPLQASSELSSLETQSSSNKAASGIVSNHVQQKGFAVFDSTEGAGLFFVVSNLSEYNMWVQAISMVLKKGTKTPDNISSTDLETDNKMTQSEVTMDHAVPQLSSSNVEPFAVFDGTSTTSGPVQPPSFGKDFEQPVEAPPPSDAHVDIGDDPFGTFDVHAPTAVQEEISQTKDGCLDDVDMDDLSMEEISLDGSEKRQDEVSAFSGAPSAMETPSGHPTVSEPCPPPTQAPQPPVSQPLSMRERLALAKGKSNAKFGSALKTAKGGMLAAGEISRDGIKQAMTNETNSKEEQTKRSIAVGKMSRLKMNASTKLTAARSTMQDRISAQAEESIDPSSVPPLPSSSSRDELSGNRKLIVGQKLGNLKKNASTKLTNLGTSVRSSIQEPPLKNVTEVSSDSTEVQLSFSQDEVPVNRSGKQDLRKKLANLEGSMSNTMRRLKIDEKVTQLSSAVKSGVKNDPVMRQLSNVRRSHLRGSDHPRQRIGIGEENKSIKPIKLDARETFSSSSDLPFKVKSITSGEALLVDDSLTEKVQSLRKVHGNWIVTVSAVKCFDVSTDCTYGDGLASESVPIDTQEKWKYKIMTRDISDGPDSHKASVERTIPEVLSFHTLISEMVMNQLPSAPEAASQESLLATGTIHPIFEKLSTLDRLRVCGTLLQRALEVNNPNGNSTYSMRDKQCDMIKIFTSTLLECHLPKEAASATESFLNIRDLLPKSDDEGTQVSSLRSVDEAFDIASKNVALKTQTVSSMGNSNEFDSNLANSTLLTLIMDSYNKAMMERDEALASLATTSIINDNHVMKEYLGKSKGESKSQSKAGSSDEEMMNLCKHLGSEIALRTTAETEINRLNERLEFEKKVAQAKEAELQAKIARYEKETQNTI